MAITATWNYDTLDRPNDRLENTTSTKYFLIGFFIRYLNVSILLTVFITRLTFQRVIIKFIARKAKCLETLIVIIIAMRISYLGFKLQMTFPAEKKREVKLELCRKT